MFSKLTNSRVFQQLICTKDIDELREIAEAQGELSRSLGAIDLTMMGIGCIIGTGIFVLTGTVAANNSGPAIVVSFVISGLAASFAALCYAELASMIPISGSAYTFAYATLGEFVAWIIGWDLILEYLVGAAAVAVGWSAYFQGFLMTAFGVTFPRIIGQSPFIWQHQAFAVTGSIIDLPATVICLILTVILICGIKESSKFNAVIVIIKVFVVLLFICATASKVNPSYWSPFVPENTSNQFGHFGASGILQGATTVFFAYIGFDSVTTTAQECRRPQRDLPIGIISSLVICTVLYIAVSIILTGLVPYSSLNVANPISFAVHEIGMDWLATIISVGAIAGLTSVLLISLMGQPRIFYSMAKDGLFPKIAAKIHPRFKTPYVVTLISGIFCSICAGLLPIDILAELTSIGTLFAFFLVSLGILILRKTRPDIPRKFRVPGGDYFIPICGMLTSALLVATANATTISRLFVWMAIGIVIYFSYGFRHSALNNRKKLIQMDREDKIAEIIALHSIEQEEQ